MGPSFDDVAVIHHEDLVAVMDGTEPVGHHENGHAGAELFQRCLDAALGDGVQTAGRLIQDQDLRLPSR